MREAHLLLALGCVAACGAIDMKWTPNGEGPAPFSTNARQQMGMDPAAMAGGAPAAPVGGGLQFGVGALFVMYLANNWKVVVALQKVLGSLLAPLLGAAASRRDQAEQLAAAKKAEAARRARVERLARAAK